MTADVAARDNARLRTAVPAAGIPDRLLPAAVHRLLDGLRTGDWSGIEDDLRPDVLYDATVPGAHYRYRGREQVAREYRCEWTGRHPWRLVECRGAPTPSGAVVALEARWGEPGDEEACRLANLFVLDEEGRIAEHHLWCCGEWDPETVRHVDAGLDADPPDQAAD